MEIIGRKHEIEQLAKIMASPKPEFLAVYGRRRVGKTYLLRAFFKNEFDFYVTGLAKGNTQQQLTNFTIFLNQYFAADHPVPQDWLRAFNLLRTELEKKETDRKKIIFIDEMPWLDTKKSDFLLGLEFFWNSWASAQSELVLIVCGSAASWMINNLIKNTGGLYNRITRRIKLEPLTLKETEDYLRVKNVRLDRYQIIQLYMVTGGIPFYLDEIEAGKSAMQNIEAMCFKNNGKLRTEFSHLFSSLFKNAGRHETILKAIFQKGGALTREDLIQATGLRSGGHISKVLSELEESGFLSSFQKFGLKKAKLTYCISDFYTVFYFSFIENAPKYETNMWLNMVDNPAFRAWSGFSFEQVCFAHVNQIKKALSIGGVSSSTSTWQWKGSNKVKGAQVDLVIDRRDQVINLFEIKFSINPITITKAYDEILRNKIEAFKTATDTKKSIFLTLLTTQGVVPNEYANSTVHNQLTMDALFED